MGRTALLLSGSNPSPSIKSNPSVLPRIQCSFTPHQLLPLYWLFLISLQACFSLVYAMLLFFSLTFFGPIVPSSPSNRHSIALLQSTGKFFSEETLTLLTPIHLTSHLSSVHPTALISLSPPPTSSTLWLHLHQVLSSIDYGCLFSVALTMVVCSQQHWLWLSVLSSIDCGCLFPWSWNVLPALCSDDLLPTSTASPAQTPFLVPWHLVDLGIWNTQELGPVFYHLLMGAIDTKIWGNPGKSSKRNGPFC